MLAAGFDSACEQFEIIGTLLKDVVPWGEKRRDGRRWPMAALAPHDPAVVPRPLAQYARGFDDLFHTHIQRRRFREYLAGLLLPRDRTKTLTALVGAEPITQGSRRRRPPSSSNCSAS